MGKGGESRSWRDPAEKKTEPVPTIWEGRKRIGKEGYNHSDDEGKRVSSRENRERTRCYQHGKTKHKEGKGRARIVAHAWGGEGEKKVLFSDEKRRRREEGKRGNAPVKKTAVGKGFCSVKRKGTSIGNSKESRGRGKTVPKSKKERPHPCGREKTGEKHRLFSEETLSEAGIAA